MAKQYSNSKQIKASQYWYGLTPMQRLEIMGKVEYTKSIATMFRRCIAYIIENVAL
jgi:hypothetical protein